MCGISGILRINKEPIDLKVIQQANTVLSHRGPDDEGYLLINTLSNRIVLCGGSDTNPDLDLPDIDIFCDERFDLAFGFRRLSILDLSPAGHQPMTDVNGNYFIIFNGEIYNYIELRAELKDRGYIFRTATDTEVILAAYAEWGEACLERFNGMWAFALWDHRQGRLFCSRDRFGIKPFYYYWDGETFAFASEIKSLLESPHISGVPNESIIYDYLKAGLIDHTSETFFANIKQLAPAHYLVLGDNRFEIRRYWDLDPSNIAESTANGIKYEEQFYQLFEDAIRIHLRSDVPIGTCLSGGLDSSSIVCITNQLLFSSHVNRSDLIGAQQKTFSSCFEDQRFDERKYIEQVLAVTNAEPNYTFPEGKQLPDLISRLIWHQDEPFASTSIYAQWWVMHKASERGVKVLLDGQGGDELLAGYQGVFRYYWASLLKNRRWSMFWKEIIAYERMYNVSLARSILRSARYYLPDRFLSGLDRLRLIEGPGLNKEFLQRYRHRKRIEFNPYLDPLSDYLYALLTRDNLPALLRYEDRNSMAFSIEARVPFLDYRLVEYAFSLPTEQKIKDGVTKVILRNALQGHLPEAIRTRSDKMGFVTPERIWLTNALKDWIRDIVNSESFRTRGYFDVTQVLETLEDFEMGKRDLSLQVWRWVNVELWFREMVDR